MKNITNAELKEKETKRLSTKLNLKSLIEHWNNNYFPIIVCISLVVELRLNRYKYNYSCNR